MLKKVTYTLIMLLPFIVLPMNSQGQPPSEESNNRKSAVKIFFDCVQCDMNYIRQEIPYINYVRDVNEAQIYVLETSQNAGSGGNKYTYTFQGLENFKGMNDTLAYTTSPDQTTTIVREMRTKMLKMGLVQYVAKTPLFSEIEIKHNQNLEAAEVVDKWNNWVFELSTEPRFNAEEANSRINLNNTINISKITPDIKLQVALNQYYSRDKYNIYSGTDSAYSTTYITGRKAFNGLFTKSINDHWSAGLNWKSGSSTKENYKFQSEFLPSIEYDIYPYSEATHRQLRVLYGVGYQYNRYVDTTLLGSTQEGLGKQSLSIAYQIQKKWGSINLSLDASNYLNDFSKNRVELTSFVNVRLFKGLSLRVNGSVAHINDQINLKGGGYSEAERLLKLSEIGTKYRISGGIEITYTFGSIYNNVVNPRFGSDFFRSMRMPNF
jgi:hypothetical protein